MGILKTISSAVLLIGPVVFGSLAANAQGLHNGSRVIVGGVNYCPSSNGTDTYGCNLPYTLPGYVTGACYAFKADVANTGPASINFSSAGNRTIKKAVGGVTTDLADNDIRAGQMVQVCYDGTNMQMQSVLGNAGVGGGIAGIDAKNSAGSTVMSAATSIQCKDGTNTTCAVTNEGGGTFSIKYDATGGGSAATMVDTGDRGFWFWGPFIYSQSYTSVSGGGNYGVCHEYYTPVKTITSNVSFQIQTASGTGCSGGVCGMVIAVYDKNKNKIAQTEVGTSSSGTASKNINNTTNNGMKTLAWLSGSSVSAGKLTLNPGTGWVCTASDSAALTIAMWPNLGALLDVSNYASGGISHGYQSGLTTGNGASLSFVASWSGTLTGSGSGAELPALYVAP